MKEYISAMLTVSAAAGIISSFAPEGGNLSKYVKYALSLAVTILLLSPLSSALDALFEFADSFDYDTNSSETVELPRELYEEMVTRTEKAVTEALCGAVKEKYGIDISMTLILDDSDYSSVIIEGAEVTMHDADALYRDAVEKYISDILDCKVKFRTVK